MANELANVLKTSLLETASAAGLQNLALSELSPILTPTSSELQKALDNSASLPCASVSIGSGSLSWPPKFRPPVKVESATPEIVE